jgi:hypothetical protein
MFNGQHRDSIKRRHLQHGRKNPCLTISIKARSFAQSSLIMLTLLNAIYSKFTGAGALAAAFPGGLHRDQAPETASMPYLVSRVVQSKLEYSYTGPCRSDTQVKFSAYGVGHDVVGSLMQTLIAEFDDAPLTLSSGAFDSVTRLGEPTPNLLKHDAQGNDVWEWGVTYEYAIQI